MTENSEPLTRSFKDLVQRHVTEDPAYAEALASEDVDAMAVVGAAGMLTEAADDGETVS